MLRRSTSVVVVAICLLILPAQAGASGADVLIDCNDNGRLTKQYSQREYRQALAQMPSDLKQYTDCEYIIRQAQLGLPGAQANAGNPSQGATPEEETQLRKDIASAVRSGNAGQRIGPAGKGGFLVTPGSLSFTNVPDVTSELPTPLLVFVVLVLLATAGSLAHYVRNRRRERTGDAGP